MKLELRRVSYSKRLSQETPAFAADVWVDGEKRGTAQNDGGGGAHLIQPHALSELLEEHAKTLPDVHAYGLVLKPNAEMVIGDLLDDYLLSKDLKSAMKRKVLFTCADGKLYEMRGPERPKRDVVKVLNDVPFEEALALYKTAGAR